ncbi:DUF6308 family protein [Actinoplanes sp. DH11]|uniref:DUF6308 family protein n=1 Tax=Actinoplanes sp. DH11 TaxID=2857011 RepID=UPI001E4F945A|nr:DUF6308 family protein [Actinoplanes sp. DH11]
MPEDLTDIVRAVGTHYLVRYFAEPPATTYTGRWFETLGGGGAHDAVRNRITGDDLIAVEGLSVEIPAEARRDLIDGPLGASIGSRLAEIPTAVPITDPRAALLLRPGGDADEAHKELKAARYVHRRRDLTLGHVIAGKLLARKRPELIPVYDSRVKCQLGRPAEFWLPLHQRFAGDGGALSAALTDARVAAGVADLTSDLRALDVVLWMRHEDRYGTCQKSAKCPGFHTASLTSSHTPGIVPGALA